MKQTIRKLRRILDYLVHDTELAITDLNGNAIEIGEMFYDKENAVVRIKLDLDIESERLSPTHKAALEAKRLELEAENDTNFSTTDALQACLEVALDM